MHSAILQLRISLFVGFQTLYHIDIPDLAVEEDRYQIGNEEGSGCRDEIGRELDMGRKVIDVSDGLLEYEVCDKITKRKTEDDRNYCNPQILLPEKPADLGIGKAQHFQGGKLIILF